MILNRNLLKLIVSGFLICSLTACNNAGNAVKESNIYTFDIDGNKVCYSPDSPEAISINELVEGFLQTYIAVDYKNFDGLAVQEYYTQDVKKANIANGIHTINERQIKDNEVQAFLNEVQINAIKISEVGPIHKADVSGVLTVTYTHGKKEYLEQTDTQMNVLYKRRIEMKVEKEDGNWKILQSSIYPKEKA